ncbi:MAG: HEAT repeat domain-containing protein [Deltaproteobacteria bacterium]|nr:MAG: HEAT repeat domain-containing protein [Deltaproteobacteria bacterium]
MKLVASVSELGLLGGLARSPRSLAVVSLVSLAASVIYGLLVADHVIWSSSSVGLNLTLITGQFFFVLFGAYVHAMLAGSLLFGDKWRRRVLVGERLPDSDGDAPDEDLLQIDRFKDNTLPFYGLFAVLLFANWFAVQVVSGNYLQEYNRKGYHLTLMRAEEPNDRARAVRSLLDPINRATGNDPDVREKVRTLLDDPVPGVRLWAIWAVGHLEIVRGHGQLVSMLDSEDGEILIEVIEAIGRLRLAGEDGERRLLAMLPATIGDDRRARAVLHALGFLRNPDSAGPVTSLLGLLPSDLEVVALWAIGEMRTTAPREAVIERWSHAEAVEDHRLLCATAEAMKHVTTVDDDARLRVLFRETPAEIRCDQERWMGRSFEDDEPFRPVEYVMRESLRMKYMKAVFNIGGRGLREWLVEIAWDTDEDPEIRRLADQMAEALRNAPARPPREALRTP